MLIETKRKQKQMLTREQKAKGAKYALIKLNQGEHFCTNAQKKSQTEKSARLNQLHALSVDVGHVVI